MHFNDAYSQDLTAAAVVTVVAVVAAVAVTVAAVVGAAVVGAAAVGAAVVGAAVFAAVVVAAAVTIFQSISPTLLHDTKQIKKHRGHIKQCYRYVALIFSSN